MTETIESKMDIKPKVVGRIFIKGTLQNISPMALSDGQNKYSDSDIYRDYNGIPMIPGTSIMGVLRERLYEEKSEMSKYLFGSSKTDEFSFQSHLIVDDIYCKSKDVKISIRDGVRIDHSNNLAIDRSKYDYEILEPVHEFDFTMEITVREGLVEEKVTAFVQSLCNTLCNEQEHIQVGSMTSFGFGQLKATGFKTTGILKAEKYFKYLDDIENTEFWSSLLFEVNEKVEKYITLALKLKLTTPLFIGGGVANTPDADDASLNYNGKYILSAKSMKGAIRHHAYKIANTIHGEDEANKLCNLIFGNSDQDKLTKSNFWTSDANLENTDTKSSQARVAIDRFTGGAIKGALFSTEPAFPKDETYVKITWKLNVNKLANDKDVAVGLMLLVARDLATEMLPIGGDKAIGRGRFEGKELIINDNGKELIYIFPNKDSKPNNETTLSVLKKDYIEPFLNLNK